MGGTGSLLPLLYILVGLCTAGAWRTKEEYKFELNGRTLAFIPSLGNDMTGVHYKGELLMQSYATDALMLQLRNLSYVRVQKNLADGWWEQLPEDEYRSMPVSESTFSAKLKKGLVEHLVVTTSMETWETNFIQGIVSHLQFDLTGSSSKHNFMSNSMHGRGDYENASTFSIMEEAVSGRCEVQYQVTEIPKPVMWANPGWAAREDLCGSRPFIEVVKTRNYSNCEKNPEYHFGLPNTPHCQHGADRCGDLWTRASLTQMVGCGPRRNFLLLTSVSTHNIVANLHLHNGTEAAVQSYLNLTLISAKPISRKLGLPFEPTKRLHGLTYNYKAAYSPESQPASIVRSSPPSSVELPPDSMELPLGSIELPLEEEKRRDHHRHRHGSKDPHKNSRQKRGTKRPKSTASEHLLDFDLDISEEKLDKQWALPAENSQRPPHRPMSAFSLTHSEGDVHACLNQQFKELLEDIAGNIQNTKVISERMTLEKVKLAVDMCRTMMFLDLQKCEGGLMDIQSRENPLLETERKVLRDVYAMCGTNPAFNVIKSWLVQKKVTGEEAASLLATLPDNLQTPTAETVNEFYELTRNPALAEDDQVKISAVLAFSNLLRVACVRTQFRDARYSTELLEPVCTPKAAAHYLPWFITRLRSDAALRSVYLTALGNTAHPSAISHLQSVAEDPKMTPYIRSTAVFSMKYLVFADPDAMNSVLMTIYDSYKNPLAVRMAALSLLMFANPGLPVWQRVAISSWYEPSPAMVSFIWTSIKSMAEAQDSTYQPLFESARAVLPFTKPADLASYLPENFLWTAVNRELSSIVMNQLSWSSDLQASHVYVRPTHRMGKIPHIMAQAEVSAANPDGLLQLFLEFMTPKDDMVKVRPPRLNVDRSTRWIHESLKIAARTLPRIEGAMRFSFNNLHERVIPFDKKIVADALKAGRKAVEQHKLGKQFHYQKMDQEEMEIGTANDLGLPVSLRLKTIFLIRSTGATEVSSDNMHLTADINFVYASQMMAELSAFPQWDGLEYMAASYVSTHLRVPPIHLETNINKTENQVQVSVQCAENDEDVKLLHSSKPFIAQRNLLILTPVTLASNTHFFPVRNQKQLSSTHYMNITYASNDEPSTLSGWLQNGVAVYGMPMVWHTLKPAYFKMELTNLAPIQVNFTMVTAEMEKGELTMKALFTPEDVESETTTTTLDPRTESENVTSSEEEWQTTSASSTSSTTASTTTSTTQATTPSTTTSKPEIPQEIVEDESENITVASLEPKSDLEFNATIVDPFSGTKNGSHFKYILDKILSKIDYGEAVALGINYTFMSEKPAKYHGFLAYGHAMGGSTKRAAFYLKDNQTNWQIGVTSDMYLVPGPLLNIADMLKRNMTTKLAVSLMKRSFNGTTVASFKGSATRSDLWNSALHNSSDVQHCLKEIRAHGNSAHVHTACRRAARQAAFADRFEAQLRFSPGADDRTSLGWLNGNTSAVFKMSSKEDKADVWVRFPSREFEYIGMRIPFLLSKAIRQYNPDHSAWEQFAGTASCGVTADNVTTYDGVYFPYYMGNCWHVLTKDCSGKSRVVVLGKTENNVTVVEINMDNFQIISLLPDLRIDINQRLVQLSTNQTIELEDLKGTTTALITTSPDKAIRVRLPEHDVTVMYFNSTVLITSGFGNRGRLCGICGDHNGEKVSDLTNPSGALEQYPQKFAASYALRVEDCEVQRKM